MKKKLSEAELSIIEDLDELIKAAEMWKWAMEESKDDNLTVCDRYGPDVFMYRQRLKHTVNQFKRYLKKMLPCPIQS